MAWWRFRRAAGRRAGSPTGCPCRAGLQETVARVSARVERERGVRVQLRVGLTPGQSCRHSRQQPAYGLQSRRHTVNLAARMEQTAAPEPSSSQNRPINWSPGISTALTWAGQRQGRGREGACVSVTGERGGRARIDVARERGFTRLIGREREVALLHQCFELARGGRGQAVSIIGDAGLGNPACSTNVARPSPATTAPGSTAAAILRRGTGLWAHR